MSNTKMIELVFYVAGRDDESDALIKALTQALTLAYGTAGWSMAVVDVLLLPEKALERDVFATPTFLRLVPAPILKVLGDISQTPQVMAMLSGPGVGGHALIV